MEEYELYELMENKLDKLVKEEYLWGYDLKDNELTIRYGLYSVSDTERTLDIKKDNLKQALLKSSKDLEIDIRSSLTNENDFYGYENENELNERIKEETKYLKLLSELV